MIREALIVFGAWLGVDAAILLLFVIRGVRRGRAEERLPNVEPPEDEGVQ